VCHPSRVELDDGHRWVFEFIRQHPDIFPGFFHYDLEHNVRPKLEALREHGFYATQHAEAAAAKTESCGAHSPRVDDFGSQLASRLETARTTPHEIGT